MKNHIAKTQAAGLALFEDNRLYHVRFLKGNRTRVRRFHDLQMEALSIQFGSELAFPAHLLFFDLVPLQYLGQAIENLSLEFNTVEWKAEDGKLHRRLLSKFTQARLSNAHTALIADSYKGIPEWLGQNDAYRLFSSESLAEELELDCIAWASRNLAMPLWSNIAGVHHLTGLPTPAFHRYMGKFCDLRTEEKSEGGFEVGATLSDILDNLHDADSADSSPVDLKGALSLIEEILRIFRARERSPLDRGNDEFHKGLQTIRNLAVDQNYWVGVVVCWMLDLFESGTPQKIDAAIETRTRYCRVAAQPLLQGLLALNVKREDLDVEQLEALSLSLMSDPAVKDKRGLGAAISSFLLFMHEEFDAPVVRPQLHQYIPEILPRAQYISAEEIQLARLWIEEQHGADSRLILMSRLILALGLCAPFRKSELFNLRISNVQPTADQKHFEVEITPSKKYGKLKTDSSNHRVRIEESWAIEELQSWLLLRSNEGAVYKDLLFGAPDIPHKVYRKSALNRVQLKVLKLCTGDAEMTFHALRHSWACRRIDEVLRSRSEASFDRLAHIAYAMGHASIQMTLRFYLHTYEAALKHEVDQIQISIDLTSHQGFCLTGIKANTLVQRAIRTRCTVTQLVESHIQYAQTENSFLSLREATVCPAPKLIGTFAAQVTPMQIFKVLEFDQHGKLNDELIAARTSLETAQVSFVRGLAKSLALELSPSGRRFSELMRLATDTSSALRLAKIRLDAARQSKYQKLMELMRLPVEFEIAETACLAWRKIARHGYLDATDEISLTRLLCLLKLADVDPAHLILRVEACGQSSPQVAISLRNSLRSFRNVFGTVPESQTLDYSHPARPKVSLVWAGLSNGSRTASAAVSTTGLNSLMFVLAVYVKLTKEFPHVVAT